MDSFIDAHSIAEYGFDDTSIALAVDGWDVSPLPAMTCVVSAVSAISKSIGMPIGISA